jgi:pimeloyl-ACP methyl ester carboxylesterase
MNSSLRGVSPFYRRLRPGAWTWFARALVEKDPLRRERVILGLVSNRPDRREETARRWVEIQRARPISLESFARQLGAAARHEPPDAPPPVPTLLLAGEGDRLCSSDCSRDLALRFALPLETHPSAGHALDLDEPEWTLARVRAFLAPLAVSRGAAPALAASTGR